MANKQKSTTSQINRKQSSSVSQPNAKMRISDLISLAAVIIATLGLILSFYTIRDERNQDQFKNANQAFILNTISSDFKGKDGEIGKEITTTFQNASPNPVFDVVLVAPKPLGAVTTSAEHYHEFSIKEDESLAISFPTLPPGERIEHIETYSQDLFGTASPREVLDKEFYFCFTDVKQQRWVADYRGAKRIKNPNDCYRDDTE